MSPPRAGKTVLMQSIAHAITANHPDAVLLVLLVDERPEEVTEMTKSVRGEVIASTFDEPAKRHVKVADIVINKARRLAASEQGANVVVVSPTVCIGPWDVKRPENCWVPALLNGEFTITPEQRLNVIDTRDVASAVVSIMEGSQTGGPINLSGQPIVQTRI